MAKQIEGVYERVIECARKEFLAYGFKDASLRRIANAAKTSTGSIYTRFGDKEGLFRAIVEPAVDELKQMFKDTQENFHQIEEERQKELMPKYSGQGMDNMLEFIYGHFEEFALLLDASYGTQLQNFMDELVEIEVEYTYKYMKVIGCKTVEEGIVTEDFLHIIVGAYFSAMFEVVRHRMKKEDAKKYMNLLKKYHMAGFDTVFSPEKYNY